MQSNLYKNKLESDTMSKNDNDYNQFLPGDNLNSEKIFFEVPADLKFPYQERIPSGYDPMGEIYLRGRASRSLASGRIPWWVLISGWLFFGGLALFTLIPAITLGEFSFLPALAIIAIFFVILGRGTAAKLSIKKRKNNKRI
jgi:hypothetical protein